MMGVHAFPKSINPKVNIIAQLGIELAYFETAVQHFRYYAMGTPHPTLKVKRKFLVG